MNAISLTIVIIVIAILGWRYDFSFAETSFVIGLVVVNWVINFFKIGLERRSRRLIH